MGGPAAPLPAGAPPGCPAGRTAWPRPMDSVGGGPERGTSTSAQGRWSACAQNLHLGRLTATRAPLCGQGRAVAHARSTSSGGSRLGSRCWPCAACDAPMGAWAPSLVLTRPACAQFGKFVMTTSSGIMDHEEARRKKVGGKVRRVLACPHACLLQARAASGRCTCQARKLRGSQARASARRAGQQQAWLCLHSLFHAGAGTPHTGRSCSSWLQARLQQQCCQCMPSCPLWQRLRGLLVTCLVAAGAGLLLLRMCSERQAVTC